MDRQRMAAAALGVALLFAALTDYIPQFGDESGKVFGLFALDIYKDALHVASGVWAAAAALTSRRASEAFLQIFGVLYLADGIMGSFTGSGFLDLRHHHRGRAQRAAHHQGAVELAARVARLVCRLVRMGERLARRPHRNRGDMNVCLKRIAITGAVVASVLIVAAAVPIVAIETGCGNGAMPRTPAKSADVQDAGYQRAEGDSYLTYPEWYIVHAYADLAGVTRRSSESDYHYGSAIKNFWSSMCRATETARKIGPVTADQRITDYVIGISFSLEMAVQGLYERTVGAVTAWIRGSKKTPEDEFNQRFLDDYAAFLQQTPWYQYSFKTELSRFWRDTPWSSASPVRSVERGFALTLEYGLKGLYAVAIGALASYAPADPTIMTVIRRSGDSAVNTLPSFAN
jgi:Domain of unknown function (DUF4383)